MPYIEPLGASHPRGAATYADEMKANVSRRLAVVAGFLAAITAGVTIAVSLANRLGS
ncbi:hypothetical protein [Leifsonia aquatica]|uniref:hypothetical protein n=1 Tax=Leifsonia aquatica TaxID=144185 RepID=UPI00382B715A